MNYVVEKLNINDSNEIDKIKAFLNSFQLSYEKDIDYTIVIREAGEIIATCSKSKDVLKGFAVKSNIQGEGITNLLIKSIQDQLFKENIFHSFIFTKPLYKNIFQSFGYKIIAEVEGVILLEYGFYGINKILMEIKKEYSIDGITPKSALVMNCNPFTLGHYHIIRKASLESKEVLVFLVEEDSSIFPFKTRYHLVREGTKGLKNVKIIPGGKYIISKATFPTYFLKEENELLDAYTKLDATIFGEYFCKIFNIKQRFLGEEPYCKVTQNYNISLKEILGFYKVKTKIISRVTEYNSNEVISASRVRALIKSKEFHIDNPVCREDLDRLVPKTTLDYLYSKGGREIIKKIKLSNK